MPGSVSYLKHLSVREAWKSTSSRWGGTSKYSSGGSCGDGGCEGCLKQMQGMNNMYGGVDHQIAAGEPSVMRKRVMVVVDQSSHSKHAMMWALNYVANKGDFLTLLHIIPAAASYKGSEGASYDSSSCSPYLANSLGSLCKACRPEVEVEALVIQGPKLATVMNQAKKLEVSVLVLGQKKPSLVISCLRGTSSTEEFVQQCINNAECLTVGVRKQSRGMGGYLISTRWQKNFWLLA